MKTQSLIALLLTLTAGAAVAQNASGGLLPGKTYIVTCGAEDAQGNFTCHKRLVDSDPGATGKSKTATTKSEGVQAQGNGAAVAAAPVAASSASEAVVAAGKRGAAASEPAVAIAAAKPADAVASAVVAKSATEAISDLLEADLSVPASPAASLLGISGDKVQRPGTLRELAGSVIRGIGADGKPQSAIALDVAPVFVLAPSYIGAGDQYAPETATSDWDGTASQHWHRVLARTTVSFGTTNPDSSGATRSALGLRTGLFDSGDPGLYWAKEIKCIGGIPGVMPLPPSTPGQPADEIPVDYSKCDVTKDSAVALWAKPSLYVGYGQSWYSKSGALTDHAPDVKQFWLSGSAGWVPTATTRGTAGEWRTLGQIYFGRRMDDRIPDPSDATKLLRKDSTDALLRLRAGKSKWHGFFEFGRSRVYLGDSSKEDIRHTALGAEFQLNLFGTDNWFELAGTSERGYLDGKDHSGVLLNFRMGTPSLALPKTGAVAQH